MPPGQPIHRCQDCETLRPCRPFDGRWLCIDCAPVTVAESDPTVATDGGQR